MNRLCVMADVLKIPNRGQTWATNNLPAGFLDLTDHWTNTSRNIGVIMELNLNRIRTIKKKNQLTTFEKNMARNAAFLTEEDSSEHRGLLSL